MTDNLELSPVERLNLELAQGETREDFELVRQKAETQAKTRSGEALRILNQIQAITNIEVGDFASAADIFIDDVKRLRGSSRAHTIWVMAAYLHRFADKTLHGQLISVLRYPTESMAAAEYLYRLTEVVSLDQIENSPHARGIIENFFQLVGFDTNPTMYNFVEYAEKFFQDRSMWNRGFQDGRTLNAEDFRTEYWQRKAKMGSRSRG